MNEKVNKQDTGGPPVQNKYDMEDRDVPTVLGSSPKQSQTTHLQSRTEFLEHQTIPLRLSFLRCSIKDFTFTHGFQQTLFFTRHKGVSTTTSPRTPNLRTQLKLLFSVGSVDCGPVPPRSPLSRRSVLESSHHRVGRNLPGLPTGTVSVSSHSFGCPRERER